ncbi:MAG: hypothetical protein B9J98_04195 [Candidatus Terraquivivens tikiterensis]|uniref:DUF3782 domain-containing protein n=1 Tax=Candidatus Terraquivivens tikiterensis TaxID=1980982 RepID=A0A2R7Y3E1_9ARCH|nr:MAG: hypothetical protein B9J98_04195 [Candidatus Terraquivivens tikiterensis]
MALKELKSRILKLLREDEEFRYAVAGLIGLDEVLKRLDRHEEELVRLREDMVKGFERYGTELARLREDMNRGFELVNRHISALGARWGLMAEEAFREGLRGVLEKELGFKVEKWKTYDEEGKVFGYPSEVEIDVTVEDGEPILVEVSSHVRASDVYQFKRKAELYAEKTGKKPKRLIMVSPYVDEKAVESSGRLGIEVYAKV